MELIYNSNAEYHGGAEISSSQIKTAMDNVRKYKFAPPMTQTEDMMIGSAIHKWALERDDFYNEFIVTEFKLRKKIKKYIVTGKKVVFYNTNCLTPKGELSTKGSAVAEIARLKAGLELNEVLVLPKYKEEYDFFMKHHKKGVYFINSKQLEHVQEVAKKIESQIELFKMLGAVFEPAIYGEINGFSVKMRPDIAIIDHKRKIMQIIDLKTTSNPADKRHFQKQARDLKFFIQQAWYELVAEANGYTVTSFTFMYVSRLEWSNYEVYVLYRDLIDKAKDVCLRTLDKIKTGYQTQQWKEGDYDDGEYEDITPVYIPLFYAE